jgi:hypothetical protein
MLFFFFFLIALSLSQNITFETSDSQINLLTTDYPNIIACEPNCNAIFMNRILYLQENWTWVKLQIILKDAEGFLLSNQSYLITKESKEEEEKEEEERSLIQFLPFVSILVCILSIFLIVHFNRKSKQEGEAYIYNKQKDRALASDFYNEERL